MRACRASHRTGLSPRLAFTLVELMTIVVIIGVLLTLAVTVLPRLNDQRAAARGADQLQGWLLIAKSRAMRDQAPRGLRLIVDPNNSGVVRQLEYVEQPTNYQPVSQAGANSSVIPLTITPNGNTPTASAQVSLNGFNEQYAIQQGDFLELMLGTPRVFLIQNDPSQNSGQLQLSPPILNAEALPFSGGNTSTTNYQIVRRWRPLTGEATLQMPNRVVIDISTNASFSRPLPSPDGSNIVIMFSPSGALLDAPSNRAIMWVRSEDNVGEPTLITVYSKNGAISAQPVDMSNNMSNPYSFTSDGLGSGL